MLPGLASTWPRSTSSFSTPRRSTPMLSPATPSSSSLRNISTPVTTFFSVGRKPTISISSPTLTLPRSTRPVTTVPRPEIEKTSSLAIIKGFSPLAPAAGPNRAGAGDRKHVLDRHHERLVHLALRYGDVAVERLHQLGDALDAV